MLEANHDGASVEDNNWGGVGWVGTRLYSDEMLYLLYGLDDTQFYTNAMYCILATHSSMDI